MRERHQQAQVRVTSKGRGVVAEVKGRNHVYYEDRYRLLPAAIDLVQQANRGEIFAVFDGVSAAPMGMAAAQAMADELLAFFEAPTAHEPTAQGMLDLLLAANRTIHEWGTVDGTDRSLGACVGTIAWIDGNNLSLFHAGDTEAWLADGQSCTILIRGEGGGGVTQYWGLGEALSPIALHLPFPRNSRLLLCSDGLRRVLSEQTIRERLLDWLPAEEIARSLVTDAVEAGAPDDVTVLLVEA